MKKTFLFLPLLTLIACGPSASELEAKAKEALKREQDSIAKVEKIIADSIASAELLKAEELTKQSNELSWNYSGTLGKQPIKAQINYEEGDNSGGAGGLEIPITGYYFYESQKIKMPLKGYCSGNGMISLSASTKGGDEEFDGSFDYGNMLEDFSGTWMKGNKELNFSLKSKK
jgi:hypothetical protein